MSNLDAVRGLYEAFARKDTDAIRRTLAPDVEWVQWRRLSQRRPSPRA